MISIKLLFISLFALMSQPEKAFVERDGVVSIEAESVEYDSKWLLKTKAKGFSGEGYLTWNGKNMINKPGSGTLVFQVFVLNPGTYYLQLHNYHDHPDRTENNDLYTRINEGDWIKTYSHINKQWTWHTGFDINHVWGRLPRFELKAGLNTIQFSGRSKGFSIDKLTLVVAEKLWMETWKTQSESEQADIKNLANKTH
jgi:hypothetical protein